MNEEIRFLQKQANELRKDVIKMVYLAKDGHPGPALSIADIIATLYFKVLHIDGNNPNWEERDRFILSKGHACPVVYSALARRGFFSEELLPTLRAFGSKLQGHPDMKKTPGIDMTSGSLGNGLSIGLGMTLAAKYLGNQYHVYVVMGDGELQEGIVWEAMMTAAKYQAGRLTVFVDHNGLQSGDSVAKVSGLLPILPKFEAFGWHCREIDGHNIEQILAAIESAQNEQQRPSLILARTVKGKGVPFMEGDNSWHKRVPTKEQYEEAIAALGGDENESL